MSVICVFVGSINKFIIVRVCFVVEMCVGPLYSIIIKTIIMSTLHTVFRPSMGLVFGGAVVRVSDL